MPLLMNEKNQVSWPTAVREDVLKHVHKLQRDSSVFFASMNGRTILPLPLETPNTEEEMDILFDTDLNKE